MGIFSENWHDFNDITPDDNTDIWFTAGDGKLLFAGIYNEDNGEGWVTMADHGAVPITSINQWRYVMEAPLNRFPEDGEIIAAELDDPNARGLVTGIFFDNYYDEHKDEEIGPAMALNDIYDSKEFKVANEDGVVDAAKIINFIEVPELPR